MYINLKQLVNQKNKIKNAYVSPTLILVHERYTLQ